MARACLAPFFVLLVAGAPVQSLLTVRATVVARAGIATQMLPADEGEKETAAPLRFEHTRAYPVDLRNRLPRPRLRSDDTLKGEGNASFS